MQLKIQRSQRTGGVLGKTVFFCLDVRAEYSPEEQDNIRKYRLGGQIIYSSRTAENRRAEALAQFDRGQSNSLREQVAGLTHGMASAFMSRLALNISIDSLARGHHIECKDLEELLEAEDTVRTACKNVTRYLEVADTFDGSELVIEYDKGEEKVHITEAAPPLITASVAASQSTGGEITSQSAEPVAEGGLSRFKELWADPSMRIVIIGGAVVFLLILLHYAH